MKLAEIREKFLAYFESKGHTRVASSPLFIAADPTLMFVNSGMVQFKDVFTGADKRAYKRATTAQRSVRAGGKHNDLENVGYTARHHTFFEMLGNFSFGDYFKRDAIKYAWELLTEVYGLPKEKLLVTVYAEDDEAFGIWKDEVGVPVDRIVRIGDNKGSRYASDNFWMMGDTGPCGPCSEIFYDHGPHIPGGPPGSPEEDGDRFIEIWNLVFIQFNRNEDQSLTPLPAQHVDTGMGFERITKVIQGKNSNYDTDVFQPIFAAIQKVTGAAPYGGVLDDLKDTAYRVIADHIRTLTFALTDGAVPSNVGRGYVLRRILRRAVRYGRQMLGAKTGFFNRLVPTVVTEMGDAFPELKKNPSKVMDIIREEEESFGRTLDGGIRIFADLAAGIVKAGGKVIPGSEAFKLYDTFGVPYDFIEDTAATRGASVDREGFERAMEGQRDKARAGSTFGGGKKGLDFTIADEPTLAGAGDLFEGYTSTSVTGVPVLALFDEARQPVQSLPAGATGFVALAKTPFYLEAGGQVSDSGRIVNEATGTMAVVDGLVRMRQGLPRAHRVRATA